MGKADYLELGSWNALCYSCGFKFKASMLKRHWQGYYVCERCWEPRHPQDFVRSVPDVQTPPWAQPMPADSFRIPGGDFIVPGDGFFIPDTVGSNSTDPGSSTGFTDGPQIADPGNGYTTGDELSLSGGTGTSSTVVVTATSSGLITGVVNGTPGDYSALPTCSYGTATTFSSTAKSAHYTLSGGDLIATSDGTAAYLNVAGSAYKSAGKLYCEIAFSADGGAVSPQVIGLGTSAESVLDGQVLGESNNGYGWECDTGSPRLKHTGSAYHNVAYGGAGAGTQTVSVLWDADVGTVYFWTAGVDQGLAFTGVLGEFRIVISGYGSAATVTANFGESAWAHTPPAGYTGWSTTSLVLCSVATTGGTGEGAYVTIPTLATVSYATFDPAAKATGITLSNGNLTADTGRLSAGITAGFGSNPYQNSLGYLLMKSAPPVADVPIGLVGGMTVLSTKFQATGVSAIRRYCEVSYYGGLPIIVGLVKSTFPWSTTDEYIGQTSDSYGWLSVGTFVNNADGDWGGPVANQTGSNVICLYFDAVAGTMYIALGANAPVLAWSGLSGTFCPAVTLTTLNTVTINYGATTFAWLGNHPTVGSIDNLYVGWTG